MNEFFKSHSLLQMVVDLTFLFGVNIGSVVFLLNAFGKPLDLFRIPDKHKFRTDMSAIGLFQMTRQYPVRVLLPHPISLPAW